MDLTPDLNSPLNRRRFLQRTALGGVAMASARQAHAADAADLKPKPTSVTMKP